MPTSSLASARVFLSALLRATAVCLAVVLSPPALSSVVLPAEKVSSTDESVDLMRSVSYLIEQGSALTIEQVAAEPARFQPAGKQLHLGFRSYTVLWVRMNVMSHAQTSSQWFLHVPSAALDRVEFYAANATGQYVFAGAAGDRVPQSTRMVQHRHIVFPVTLRPGPNVFFLRVASEGNFAIAPVLRSVNDFWSYDHTVDMVFGLLFGCILGLALYNLLLAFLTKDRGFYIYVAFAVAIVTGNACWSGYAAYFLWGDAVWWTSRSVNFIFGIGMLLSNEFTRHFLSSRTSWPAFDLFLRASSLGFALSAVSALLGPQYIPGSVGPVLALVTDITTAIMAFVVWRRQSVPGSLYFFAARGAFWIGNMVAMAGLTGLLSGNYLIVNANLAGATLEMVLLSMALARRINAERALMQEATLRADAQRQIAQQMSHARILAEETGLAKSRLLAASSHDLRQPVHALFLYLSAMEREAPSPRLAELLASARECASHVTAMLNSLLDLSKLESGAVIPRPRSFAINELLKNVEVTCAALAQAKGLRLKVRSCDAVVISDPELVERILLNLVSNAIRYTDSGGILIGCRRRRGYLLSIMVVDTGRGISAEDQERMFEEFHTTGAPASIDKGLGLGLAIVRRLSDLLRVRVRVHSKVGRGSCFTFEVPLAIGSIGSAQAKEVELPPISDGNLAGRLVVIVEDDARVSNGLKVFLEQYGAQVLVARTIDHAVDVTALLDRAPDLVICDWQLEDSQTGLQVLERLNEEFATQLPAVFTTGRIEPPDVGNYVVLQKPVAPDVLLSAVTTAINDDRLCNSILIG